eukprot:1589021-Amphidinium_carterae.1
MPMHNHLSLPVHHERLILSTSLSHFARLRNSAAKKHDRVIDQPLKARKKSVKALESVQSRCSMMPFCPRLHCITALANSTHLLCHEKDPPAH